MVKPKRIARVGVRVSPSRRIIDLDCEESFLDHVREFGIVLSGMKSSYSLKVDTRYHYDDVVEYIQSFNESPTVVVGDFYEQIHVGGEGTVNVHTATRGEEAGFTGILPSGERTALCASPAEVHEEVQSMVNARRLIRRMVRSIAEE